MKHATRKLSEVERDREKLKKKIRNYNNQLQDSEKLLRNLSWSEAKDKLEEIERNLNSEPQRVQNEFLSRFRANLGKLRTEIEQQRKIKCQ